MMIVAVFIFAVARAEAFARGGTHALLESAFTVAPFLALAAPFLALRAMRVAAALPFFLFRAVVLRLRLLAPVIVVDGEIVPHTNTEFAHLRPSLEPIILPSIFDDSVAGRQERSSYFDDFRTSL
jgi:hypothetical protein